MEELIKLICNVFSKNASSIAKSAAETSKAVAEHVAKNSDKYITGAAVVGGTAAVGAAVYAKGHTDGKKEGTIEQAKRDETKMTEMHRHHEQDRKEWAQQKKNYDDLLNDINID